MDCIFCSIAAGDIPSATIYEDESLRAIFDIAPAVEGHVLVMPKQHYANLLECPADLSARLIQAACAIGRKMEDVLDCDGVNILTNIGEAAGQSVMHAHIHVLPRWKGQPEKDSLSITQKEIEKPDFDRLAALLKIQSLDE